MSKVTANLLETLRLPCWVFTLPSKRTSTVHLLTWCILQPCIPLVTSTKSPHPLTWWKTSSPTFTGWNPQCGSCRLNQPDTTLAGNSVFPPPCHLPNMCSSGVTQSRAHYNHLSMAHTPKHYTIKVNVQQQTVSIDRLKPAFLEDSDLPQVPPPPPTPPLHLYGPTIQAALSAGQTD